MPAESTGLINAPRPKPPAPKSSPKGFIWTDRDSATPELKHKFSASLQELLAEKNWSHRELCETLWGRDGNAPRNIGKGRDWMRGKGPFPTSLEAAYIAQLLDVPVARLIEPKGEFNPDLLPLRPPRFRKNKEAINGGSNGHATDTRWVRPHGVEPVFLKFESSKKHPTLVVLELKGDMPVEIAMAIMSMVASKSDTE